MPELPTGTVTFLFSDIEGSTRLQQRTGPRYAAVLADHHALLRQAWTDHGGAEIDTAGDGFFVAFPSAPQAVAAAAQAQRALIKHTWPADGTVRVRMGLHTGTPQLLGERYVGLDVVRAARIMAAGHGGQVLLSAVTHSLVEHALPVGATLRDLGTYQLKDLEHAERLWQLVLPGLPADFPPLKSLDARPFDLPPRVPGFVGRDTDLQTLCTALLPAADQAAACVAAVGMGGLGKSSLAAEVVYTLAAPPYAFPGGITWVRCDERTELEGLIWIEDQLLAAWGAALPAEAAARASTPEEGLELRERALRERLRPDVTAAVMPALVLFDNVERDLPLSRLLDTITPLGMAALLTSRTEPAAPRVRLLRPETLDAEAGNRLFAERYAGRGGSWDVACAEAATTAIVSALGGLPLAIELAAARAARTRLPLAALANELHAPDALARLSDPLDTSASVRYSLGKTLSALTPSLRTRFAALGLPEGPDWPLPVIERMLAGVLDASNDAPAAGADLEALLVYSLVGLTTPDARDTPRLRLHPLVRELAREELARLPALTQARALVGLLAGVRDLLEDQQAQGAELYRVLVQEQSLITGALRLAAVWQTDLPQVIRIIDAWGPYLFMDSNLAIEIRLLQLESARAIGDRRSELGALNGLVQTSGFSGREEDAARYRRAALDIARALGDQVEMLRMLGALSEEASLYGRPTEAEHLYAEAERLASQLGDRLTDFEALNNLGNAARALDRLYDAKCWCDRARAIARAAGVFAQEFLAEGNLAFLNYELGDTEALRRFVEQYVPYARATGDWYAIGMTVTVHGLVALRDGDLESAAADFTETLSRFEQGGAAAMADYVRANQQLLAGLQALRRGDAEMAAQSFEQAIRQIEMIGYLGDVPNQSPYARQLVIEAHARASTSVPSTASFPPEIPPQSISPGRV